MCEWATELERSALMLPDKPPVGDHMYYTLIVWSITVVILLCIVVYRGTQWCVAVCSTRCIS